VDSTDARTPVSVAVFATTLVISAAEYLGWAALGELNEPAPVALTTFAIAVVAAACAVIVARVWSSLGGLVIGLVIAWAPFASGGVVHALALAPVFLATAGLMWRARSAVVTGTTAVVCLAAGAHVLVQLPSKQDTESDLPDIILLVMDTTRSDHLSVYGYPKPTTPNLERFAERAQVYDDAWSVAPWTSPSHASMFTGLLPGEHGVDGALAIPYPTSFATLPEVLSEAGYHTGGFPGNPNLFAPGWERGFDVYLPAEYQKNHSLVRAVNDVQRRLRDPSAHALSERLLARAKRWWHENSDGPRFLFVNLIEPHAPYIPSDEMYETFVGETPREEAFAVQARMRPDGSASPPWETRETDVLARLYDAEIADMDRRIGGFIDWLDARGELDGALFVITSDHGERLGERGLVGHSLVMDPYLLRVPLIVHYPSKLEPARIAKRVQLDGLAGYVAEVAGLSSAPFGELENRRAAVAQYRPPRTIVGDMLELDPTFDAKKFRSDWCFVASDRFALEWSSYAAPIVTDLASDPDFSRDVAGDYPEETEALLAIARTLPRFAESETTDPDPELIEKLKALGYVR